MESIDLNTPTRAIHFSKQGDMDFEWVDTPEALRLDKLAREVIEDCRKNLMMAFRFLDAALWHMGLQREFVPAPLATDGATIYYDPVAVLRRFKGDSNESVRDLLHLILHCVFHQPFEEAHVDNAAWSVCCDICVEATVLEMCGKRFACADDEQRREVAERLKEMAGALTPKALYALLGNERVGVSDRQRHGISMADYERIRNLFFRDSHLLWVSFRQQQEGPSQGESQEVSDAQKTKELDEPTITAGSSSDMSEEEPQDGNSMGGDDGEDGGDSEGESAESGQDEQEESAQEDVEESAPLQEDEGLEGEDEFDVQEPSRPDETMTPEDIEQLEKEWRELSKSIQADLEHFTKGENAGTLMDALAVANRKPCDYTEFLRQFATIAEDMVINDDEFDYIFYTYGLDHYGNMPFVEPLEYKETNRVRDFVIAIDTSGSCSGELVHTFVQRTYDVLRQTEGFGSELNVHIVQCDAQIQSDTKITSLRQLEEYASNFKLRGFGGTDFRPVFAYVNQMVEEGELENLKGLIYFTDGEGTFPSRAPDYDVAFVFVENTPRSPRVPPWAMKVCMTEEEIIESK